MKVINVGGARPNFVKIASLVRRMQDEPKIEQILVHTGQHYDETMSKQFFDDLEIPRPDINLNVGSGTQAEQTAEVLKRFEPVVMNYRPDVVVVVGDVNSTIACALAAKKIGVDVAHVEAGLRSFDRTMPEEINRVLTDAISDLLFITEESAERNLAREGIPAEKIFFVGNVMIDTLLAHKGKAESSTIRSRLGLDPSACRYALVTLHRPSNVDDPVTLKSLLGALAEVAARFRVVFPIHPRTRRRIEEAGCQRYLRSDRLLAIEPLGYLDFLNLMSHAALVITDSGGIQEETTVLGVPCLTVRPNTERPVTIEEGTNHLVGSDPGRIIEEIAELSMGGGKPPRIPKLWDGHAAERIVRALIDRYGAGKGQYPNVATEKIKSPSQAC
jgi:UDP-N-acetylglucosamine 2-epimerase (non-hydrolysing)